MVVGVDGSEGGAAALEIAPNKRFGFWNPDGRRYSSKSTPKSGVSTPICSCTALEVSPILRPTIVAPPATRADVHLAGQKDEALGRPPARRPLGLDPGAEHELARGVEGADDHQLPRSPDSGARPSGCRSQGNATGEPHER